MIFRRTAPVFALAVALQAPLPTGGRHVVTEFRVFDGSVEVTASTRVRVFHAGQREAPVAEGPVTLMKLVPGLYDVEARRTADGVVQVKWLQRRSIMRYPDEGDRHLEVVNFRLGFGALQLRLARGRLDAANVAIFQRGHRLTPAANAFRGAGYFLFVIPAGRYDVRVQHAMHDGTPDTHWLLAVEVPGDATRLKLIGGESGL